MWHTFSWDKANEHFLVSSCFVLKAFYSFSQQLCTPGLQLLYFWLLSLAQFIFCAVFLKFLNWQLCFALSDDHSFCNTYCLRKVPTSSLLYHFWEGMLQLGICGMHHHLDVSLLWLGIFQIFPCNCSCLMDWGVGMVARFQTSWAICAMDKGKSMDGTVRCQTSVGTWKCLPERNGFLSLSPRKHMKFVP